MTGVQTCALPISHVQQARALVGDATCQVVAGATEAELWREYLSAPWTSPGLIVKASWLPASLGAVLAFVQEMSATAGVELSGRAAIGSGLVRVDGEPAEQRRVVEQMRSRGGSAPLFRHVVVLRATTELKQQIDVWGSLGDAAALGASVKLALDPNGILNAGRGPV